MESESASGRSATRVVAEASIAFIGTVFLLCAVFATQRWLDRHFLPSWFLPRPWLVLIESSVRVVLAAGGVWLVLWLRPRAGRFVASAPGAVVRIGHRDRPRARRGRTGPPPGRAPPRRLAGPGGGTAPPPRSAARLDLRAGTDRAARGWRARHRLLVRCGGISCPAPGRTRRSRAADDRVHRRVRDVRGRSDVGGQRARAGRRHDGDPEREPRRARLQQRSGVSEARAGTAPLPAARRRRLVVHDRRSSAGTWTTTGRIWDQAWSGSRRHNTDGWRRSPHCSFLSAGNRPWNAASR